MELCYIGYKVIRNYHTSQPRQKIRIIILRESHVPYQLVLAVCCCICQDFLESEAGRNLREDFVDYCIQCPQVSALCFFKHLLYYKTLPLCTRKITAGGRTDAGVCSRLNAIESLKTGCSNKI